MRGGQRALHASTAANSVPTSGSDDAQQASTLAHDGVHVALDATVPVAPSAAGAAGATAAATADVGMRVRARYLASQPKAKWRKRGGVGRWYDGTIAAKDEEEGTFCVAYDDGLEESGVLPEHLIVLEMDSSDRSLRGKLGGRQQPYVVRYGEEVVNRRLSVRFVGGKWYSGRVGCYCAVDGQHMIFYDDGDIRRHQLAIEQGRGLIRWEEEPPAPPDSPSATLRAGPSALAARTSSADDSREELLDGKPSCEPQLATNSSTANEPQCKRHPRCIRGFQHNGRGGHCDIPGRSRRQHFSPSQLEYFLVRSKTGPARVALEAEAHDPVEVREATDSPSCEGEPGSEMSGPSHKHKKACGVTRLCSLIEGCTLPAYHKGLCCVVPAESKRRRYLPRHSLHLRSLCHVIT